MAENTLPFGIYDLMLLAETMANGLERHGPWLKMTQMGKADFRDMLEKLRESETAFASLRSEKAAAGKWMNAADRALTEWLGKARLAVMLARGVHWSEAWIETGFMHRATNVPKAIGPRIELARRVVDFFARNPQFGVAHANVTASYGRKAYDDIIAARQVRRQLVGECNNAKRIRDGAERNLRNKMREVVLILSATIKAADARWFAFGLNQPKERGSKAHRSIAKPTAPITLLTPKEVEGSAAVSAAA